MSDEMVEKARAHYDSLPEETKYKWAGEVKPHWAFAFAASFARSAVRDALDRALTKIEAESFLLHDENGEYPAQRVVDIDDVRSALRKKWKVEK